MNKRAHLTIDQMIAYLERRLDAIQTAFVEHILATRPIYAFAMEEIRTGYLNGTLDEPRLRTQAACFSTAVAACCPCTPAQGIQELPQAQTSLGSIPW